MKRKLLVIFLTFFIVFFNIRVSQVYAVCVPAQCGVAGAEGCDYSIEYCLDQCCVLKPTPAGSSPTPGGSYEYQSCPVGQALSCGTVAEAGSQNKKRPADGFAKRISGWESPHPIIRLNIRWSLPRGVSRIINPTYGAAL